jgi:peroxiredoxin
MNELGELEAHHADFDRRNTRLVAASIEGVEDAAKTQADFPHLIFLADKDRNLVNAVQVIHPHSGKDGGDTAAPTTILVDHQGTVRWLFRPDSAMRRLSPQELLAAVNEHMPAVR